MNLANSIYTTILQHINNWNYRIHPLILDRYLYNPKKRTYLFTIRDRFRRSSTQHAIQDTCNPKFRNILDGLHPWDSFTLGKIAAFSNNRIIVGNDSSNASDYSDCDYYAISRDVKLINTDIINKSLVFEYKTTGRQIKLGFLELCNKHPILNAITGTSAFEIGQLITNNFLQCITF